MKLLLCNITCAVACISSPIAWGESQSSFEFNGEAEAGLIHNSALSVDELDDVSTQSDSGNTLKGMLEGKWQVNNNAKMAASYTYSQQKYNQFSQYDLALHQVSLDGSYKIKQTEIGLRFDGAKARLAGNTFLDFQQVSAYMGKFLAPETFLRTSLKLKDKTFTELRERDAQGFGASADLFHFLNDANTMLMFGLSAEKDNAQDDQYDYWAVGFTSKVTHKFSLFGLTSKVGVSWRYQKKDYELVEVVGLQGTSESQRDENRQVLQADWEVYLLDSLSVVTEFEHGEYQSEIATLSYQQNIANISLNYSF